MINKEAIEIIENEYECVKRASTGCDRNCSICDLLQIDKVIFEAYDLAIKALQTQTPRTVDIKSEELDCGRYTTYILLCPECGREFELHLGMDYYNKLKFCPSCGQALNWE